MIDFHALYTILTAEKEIYSALLVQARQKAHAVTKGDLEVLDAVMEHELTLGDQKEGVAAERARLSDAIASGLGMAPGSATLREIIGAIPDDNLARDMEYLRVDFSNIIGELSVQNEANQRLIQGQLNAISATIEFMSHTTVVGNGYNRSGASEDTLHRVSLLDTSV